MAMNTQDEQPEYRRNRSLPSSVVIPVLNYPDVREAVEWLCRAFGFTERLRIADHRAQLGFGEGEIVVAEGGETPGVVHSETSDSSSTPANHSIMVRVLDVDAHYEQAKQYGARIISPPTDYPYGERQYSTEDIGGHLWTFSESTGDVDPSSWGGTLLE